MILPMKMFLIVLLVLFLSGCTVASSTTVQSVQMANEEIQEIAKTKSTQSIAENIEALSFVSTANTAIRLAKMEEQLSGNELLTVFVPTNEAFSKLPTKKREEFLKEHSVEKIQEVFGYHVVKGKWSSASLKEGMVLETVSGDELTVRIIDGVLTVNNAVVTHTDIESRNGLIHVVDMILIPITK